MGVACRELGMEGAGDRPRQHRRTPAFLQETTKDWQNILANRFALGSSECHFNRPGRSAPMNAFETTFEKRIERSVQTDYMYLTMFRRPPSAGSGPPAIKGNFPARVFRDEVEDWLSKASK